jgi:hypothetical protein
LHTCLSIDRDDFAWLKVLAELLGDDADFVVTNDDEADGPEDQLAEYCKRDERCNSRKRLIQHVHFMSLICEL